MIMSDEPCLCLVRLFSTLPITPPTPVSLPKVPSISRLQRVDSEPASRLAGGAAATKDGMSEK